LLAVYLAIYFKLLAVYLAIYLLAM